jgi:hypothetical protein
MTITIMDAMTDPALFGDQFGGDSFANWRALLAGFYGLPLTDEQAQVFHTLTHRQAPTSPADELWLVIGRRGGKSAAAALLAVYEAVFNNHRDKLAPGEVATVMVIAASRPQARAVMRYVRGLFENPMLAGLVVRDSAESIELANRCTIEILTASHRSSRGYSCAAVIADEIAFWHSEGANPDAEIINAVRPSLATLGGKLIALSSPYARRGVLWKAYRSNFGRAHDRVLVAQAPSLLMNPTLPAHVVDDAYADDPIAAASEFGASFRSDVESFVSIEAVEACTRPSPLELPPCLGITYSAFTDPSGGVIDSFSLAIAHKQGQSVVIDCARAIKPPFSPEAVVAEFCELLKCYRVKSVTGDAFGGEWVREQFRKHGIRYDKSTRNRSEIYRDMLPMLNSETVELPPLPMLQKELVGLERRTARGGRDSIDHAPGGHDDLCNSVSGAAVHASKPAGMTGPIAVRFNY